MYRRKKAESDERKTRSGSCVKRNPRRGRSEIEETRERNWETAKREVQGKSGEKEEGQLNIEYSITTFLPSN